MQHQKLHEKLSEYAVFTIQTGKRCLLCLNEKYEIATYKGVNLLNKKTEIINTCWHRSKYKLAYCNALGWLEIYAINYHYNASL